MSTKGSELNPVEGRDIGPEKESVGPLQKSADQAHMQGRPLQRGEHFHDQLDREGFQELSRKLSRQLTQATIQGGTVEDGLASEVYDSDGKFQLENYLQRLVHQFDVKGIDLPNLAVAWSDLTVKGKGTGTQTLTDMTSLLKVPTTMWSTISKSLKPPVKTILDSFEGELLPGEMLLVLGRPGSGCTSFLKTLACYRDGFVSVDGDITYSGLSPQEIENHYRGEVVYAPEGRQLVVYSHMMVETC